MPIYRRPKSPHWWIRLQIAGAKIRKSTGTADRREAEEFEQSERERLWRSSKLGDRSATPFNEAAARWLIETKKRSKEKDRMILDWFCSQPELKTAPLSSIDIDSIQVLRQMLLDEGKAEATVDRYMACFRALLKKAVNEWRLMDFAPKVPMFAVEQDEPSWLTKAEFERLRKELPPHLALAAEFAVLTGLRMRSMLQLTWDRIDLRSRRAWIGKRMMKGNATHGFPLSRDSVKVLMKLKRLNPKGEHVFQWKGKPIDDCNTAAYAKALARCGLDKRDLDWHSLRHTFAAWALQGGVTLIELMELGGWRTYASVLRYKHFAVSHLAEAAEKVARKRHTRKKAARGK